MENHLLRLCPHNSYVCKLLEEIIIFNKKTNEIEVILAIVEQANTDLIG